MSNVQGKNTALLAARSAGRSEQVQNRFTSNMGSIVFMLAGTRALYRGTTRPMLFWKHLTATGSFPRLLAERSVARICASVKSEGVEVLEELLEELELAAGTQPLANSAKVGSSDIAASDIAAAIAGVCATDLAFAAVFVTLLAAALGLDAALVVGAAGELSLELLLLLSETPLSLSESDASTSASGAEHQRDIMVTIRRSVSGEGSASWRGGM